MKNQWKKSRLREILIESRFVNKCMKSTTLALYGAKEKTKNTTLNVVLVFLIYS